MIIRDVLIIGRYFPMISFPRALNSVAGPSALGTIDSLACGRWSNPNSVAWPSVNGLLKWGLENRGAIAASQTMRRMWNNVQCSMITILLVQWYSFGELSIWVHWGRVLTICTLGFGIVGGEAAIAMDFAAKFNCSRKVCQLKVQVLSILSRVSL